MTSIQDAVEQAPGDVLQQLAEQYAAIFVGPTRQAGPATPQDDLGDLLPSQDAIGAYMAAGDGALVIVMMTSGLATEVAGAPDASSVAAALQPVFDQLGAARGIGTNPVLPIESAAQLVGVVGDRHTVVSAGVFTGDVIEATVSLATAAPSGAPASSADGAVIAGTTPSIAAPAPVPAAAPSGTAAPTSPGAMDTSTLQRGLHLLADIHLAVTAQLGRAELTVSQLLDLTPGAVIELDRLAGQPLDLFVNGSLFARADVIVVDDAYAVQITEIVGDGTSP